ncbi:hypothetical protein A3F58_00035 [Candidatus Roizmanbacteria bacterium RIFCSPHIGHO2_12_FULL_37_9b]|nr:MAG: hypothetical protein A3F58_00035 [Candidatus Roizmanbacteria bacterium RIFCSPHIGHO2_12_FULL_37_9b]
MVMWITPKGEILKGTKTISMKCTNCGNLTEHVVWKQPHGFQLGTIFSRRKTLGMKKYFLLCPTCQNASKEITKEQALAMRK